jgi:hypothetical protein
MYASLYNLLYGSLYSNRELFVNPVYLIFRTRKGLIDQNFKIGKISGCSGKLADQ